MTHKTSSRRVPKTMWVACLTHPTLCQIKDIIKKETIFKSSNIKVMQGIDHVALNSVKRETSISQTYPKLFLSLLFFSFMRSLAVKGMIAFAPSTCNRNNQDLIQRMR